MRINDILYFTSDIEFDEFNEWIDAERNDKIYIAIIQRLEEQYLSLASKLIESGTETNSFALATLLVCVIDALALYIYGTKKSKERFTNLCEKYLRFSKEDSKKLYSELRCGIVHEAIIKNNVFVSLKTDDLDKNELIESEGGIDVINLIHLKDRVQSFVEALNGNSDKRLQKDIVKNFVYAYKNSKRQ